MLLFLKKIWEFIKKYYLAIVGLVVFVIGFVFGRKPNTSDIVKEDLKAKTQASKKQIENLKKLKDEHTKKRDEIENNRRNELKAIEERKKQNLKNLRNNNEKLDKILTEKHGLKKGE